MLGTTITNRAGCAAVTFGDVTTFSVTKLTVDPSFEEALHGLLTADGVEFVLEGSPLYED